jgi:mannose-6-phosphate isomerase-like protein (cupin superfamily)
VPQIGRESITIVLVLIGSSIGPAIAAIYMQTYQQELANRVSSGGSSSSSFPSPISYDLIFLTAALISAISTD